MQNRWKKGVGLVAAAVLALSCLAGAATAKDAPRQAANELAGAMQRDGSLTAASYANVGEDFSVQWMEWAVLGAEKLGIDYQGDAYLAAVESYVTQNLNTAEKQKTAGCSVFYRFALGVEAAGGNPRDIGGIDLLAAAELTVGKGYSPLSEYTAGLMALHASHGKVPATDADLTVEDQAMIGELLKTQTADGGFSYNGKSGDLDSTAMAVQALAPYSGQANVQAALERALGYLSANQMADGGYKASDTEYGGNVYAGSPNACTTAEVLSALVALKIDPFTDSRFIKEGNTVYDGLMQYRLDSGKFTNYAGGDPDNYTLGKVLYALGRFSAANPNWQGEITPPENTMVTDQETGIAVELPSSMGTGIRLKAVYQTSGEGYEKAKQALRDVVSDFVLVDLHLLDGSGNVVPLNGNQVRVSVPLPKGYDAEQIVVYRIEEDGTATRMEQVWVENGTVYFVTDHFSLYAIGQAVKGEATLTSPNTGDASAGLLVGMVGGAALLCTAILMRKRGECSR